MACASTAVSSIHLGAGLPGAEGVPAGLVSGHDGQGDEEGNRREQAAHKDRTDQHRQTDLDKRIPVKPFLETEMLD